MLRPQGDVDVSTSLELAGWWPASLIATGW
jgi:hypothetical protein